MGGGGQQPECRQEGCKGTKVLGYNTNQSVRYTQYCIRTASYFIGAFVEGQPHCTHLSKIFEMMEIALSPHEVLFAERGNTQGIRPFSWEPSKIVLFSLRN